MLLLQEDQHQIQTETTTYSREENQDGEIDGNQEENNILVLVVLQTNNDIFCILYK
jgi:hypothetical protein